LEVQTAVLVKVDIFRNVVSCRVAHWYQIRNFS